MEYLKHAFETLAKPHGACVAPNVTSIDKKERDGRYPLTGARMRRHRGDTAGSEKGDATPDLLLKHLDAALATYT